MPSQEHKHYIEGFLAGARALNAVYQKELNECVERAQFEVFGMTVKGSMTGHLAHAINEGFAVMHPLRTWPFIYSTEHGRNISHLTYRGNYDVITEHFIKTRIT